MPIVINKETGLAENLPDANAALQSGTHEIPLYDPQGNFGSAPFDAASDLLAEGYTQPNSEQLASIHKEGKYGTTTEQIKTGLEGAASAATFGLSTAAERALGVDAKAIQARREINPGAHALGEIAGLGASLLTGVGEGALLTKAANAVVPRMAENFAGRVGSLTAKGAIENLIFSSGDEASKLFSGDPVQSTETAITNIGLSALLGAGVGGGFGAASEAFKAGPGKKIENFLNTIKARADGLPTELKETAGIQVPPELSAALSGNPHSERLLQILNESNSKAGTALQDTLTEFHGNIKHAAAETFGKTAEDIESLHNISDYETGKELKNMLGKRMKEIVEPISEKYESFAEKFKAAPLSEELKADIANRVANSVSELGLEKAASDVQLKAANKFLAALPKQETVHDLKLLATNLTEEHPFGSDTYRIGKVLKGIVNDAKDTGITESMGAKAPELLSDYKTTQSEYKGIKQLIDDLNDRIHVGKSYGPQSFINNIKEAAPEDILRRLGLKGDVELQGLIQNSFPEVGEALKSIEQNKLLKQSLTNGELNTKKLFNNLQKMDPKHRSFIMAPEQMKRIEALQELQSRIPSKMNPSGTAKTLDKLWSKVPASASGMAAFLIGHNPIAAFIIGGITGHLTREVPDAVRLAMLKFLGSSTEVSGTGMHSMIQLAEATIKGEKMATSAVKNLFSTGAKVIEFPTTKAVKLLEEQVKKIAEADPKDQKDMMSIGGATGHYLPDHGAMLTMTATRNLQYLASLRPVDKALSPLESNPVPNSEQLANYQRALQIAEQPLVVLDGIKNGQITGQDMKHLSVLYPALYQRLQNKVTAEMIEHVTKDEQLTYKQKMGLATFLQQPLDKTMMPDSIISIQQSLLPQGAQQMNIPLQASPKQLNNIKKLPSQNMTPMQSREGNHNGRH